MERSACLDNETVLAFVRGCVPEGPNAAAARRIDEHLNGCADCRRLVADAAAFLSGTRPAPDKQDEARPRALPEAPRLAAGTQVSRYVIERPIGVGGGGVVYQAFDPQLKRRVACKLVRAPQSSATTGNDSDSEGRLLREAEAMAKLAHPNVVNVFDAGTYQDQVFIVMELVEGEALSRWLRRTPRSWREVVAAFVDAGRGLAGAHKAGLIHRDVKPENILVGTDGRARVTDFGLARPVSVITPHSAPPVDHVAADSTASDSGSTTTSAGTPLYMAPEQFLGAAADTRSDQFSFCVSLYAALYGRHPFDKVGHPEQSPVTRPSRDAPTRDATNIPAAVDRVLERILMRGLSTRSADRFPSMDEVVASLESTLDPRLGSSRGRIALAAAGLAGLLVVGAILGREDPPTPAVVPVAVPACGDRQVEGNEECDDGNNSDADGCVKCRWASCGDGHVRKDVEDCDTADPATREGCSARCTQCRGGDKSFTWADNGHCYTLHASPLSGVNAEAACGALGAHLVVYSTTFESRAVYQAFFTEDKPSYWIGMSHEENIPQWITGETTLNDLGKRDPPQKTDWARGFPNPKRGACVQAVPVSTLDLNPSARGASTFANSACDQTLPFVCEHTTWTIRRANGHAYRLYAHPLTWQATVDSCRSRGSHLLTIADAEEQAYVASLTLGRDTWIGATDEEQEGVFVWLTGEPFDFSAFAPGEPDNQAGTDDQVVLGVDKTWHDRPGTFPAPFICEVD